MGLLAPKETVGQEQQQPPFPESMTHTNSFLSSGWKLPGANLKFTAGGCMENTSRILLSLFLLFITESCSLGKKCRCSCQARLANSTAPCLEVTHPGLEEDGHTPVEGNSSSGVSKIP